ncbi:hypothetical protein [Candidatus Amarolinea dominans]|uniref:hypothetical protein n=1 Tax=Candidatus Amarolinea dominans TaxID=3140696 RepID=UPI003136A441|nr:hypothetical protein [Anaerolineae bacterium]
MKFVPLLIMPLLATAAVRRLGWRQAVRPTGSRPGAEPAAGLALLPALLAAGRPLRLAQRSGLNTTSILTLVREIISAWADVETANASAAYLGQAVLAGLVGLSVWRLWRAGASFTLAVAHLLLAILLLATAWFQTWYLAWSGCCWRRDTRCRLAPVLFLLSTTAWFSTCSSAWSWVRTAAARAVLAAERRRCVDGHCAALGFWAAQGAGSASRRDANAGTPERGTQDKHSSRRRLKNDNQTF